MYLNIPRAEAPLLVIKISKKTPAQRWRSVPLLSNETHDVNKFNPPRERPRNARVISAEELGAMSKNNFKKITLDRTPKYEIHSLTLMIS